MSLLSQTTKPEKAYENEAQKLNTELQIALLKYHLNQISLEKTQDSKNRHFKKSSRTQLKEKPT